MGRFHISYCHHEVGGLIHPCTTVKTMLTVHARAWLLSSNISDVACNIVSKNAMPIAAVTPVEIVSPK